MLICWELYRNFKWKYHISAINDEYENLKKLADNKLAALNDLLQGRKQFEADVDHCQHWLNEAQVGTLAEIRGLT